MTDDVTIEAIASNLFRDLCEKDDRTSPEEYPDMVLVSFEEFRDCLRPAAAAYEAAQWRLIETAPKDGTAFLAYGRHTHSPPDAQRGVMAGDHWWAIILWDVWRETGLAQTKRWVFAKDGARTWSDPTHWRPLPEPPK